MALGATVTPFPWAGGDGWIQGGSFVSHTKFQVFMSIRSLIRSFCKIVRGGLGGGRGRWLDSRWYSGVTYQISGLYVNPFSHKKFLPN